MPNIGHAYAGTVQFKINHSLELCHVMAKQILTETSELHFMKIYAV